MIELRNVTKYYTAKGGLKYILRGVSLTIPSRRNIAVLGPNGAGKSTFLRLIGGAESANSGTILTDANISWPLGLTSGFQGGLTGRKNVEFVCGINGLGRAKTHRVVDHVREFAEIGDYFDMPVNTYSSGMRARLNFGLSTAFDFDIYLIDELTSVGDSLFREKARRAFEAIRRRASLVFVSHNTQTLRESCDAALFLRDGRADFFDDLEKGIDAYQDYILERSLAGGGSGLRNLGPRPTAAKKAAKKAARKAAAKRARPAPETPASGPRGTSPGPQSSSAGPGDP